VRVKIISCMSKAHICVSKIHLAIQNHILRVKITLVCILLKILQIKITVLKLHINFWISLWVIFPWKKYFWLKKKTYNQQNNHVWTVSLTRASRDGLEVSSFRMCYNLWFVMLSSNLCCSSIVVRKSIKTIRGRP
jgi:hypothetical protein